LRQKGLTDQLIFPIATLIEDSPSGVGMGFDPPKYLENLDSVECEIEGMGRICNGVVMKN